MSQPAPRTDEGRASVKEELGPVQTFTCSKHGSFEGQVAYVHFAGRAVPFDPACPTCTKEDEAARRRAAADEQERLTRQRAEARMAALGLPPRFQDATFDRYVVEEGNVDQARVLRAVQLYARRFDTRKRTGGGLVLLGKPGTGKTHLMAALALALEDRCQPRYVDVWTLIGALKATWRKDSREDEAAALERFVRPDLLLLDEVGVQHGTETERALLHRVIDLRYQRMLPTVVAANLDEAGLKAYLGDRAVSRLHDGGSLFLQLGWGDYRLRSAA